MEPVDPHDVVRLVTADNSANAHLLKQALEAEGIHCNVVGEYLDAGIGNISGIQPELWIHRDDLARAQEIISQYRGDTVT